MKNKGFTLIELLIFIAVIGILATILITSLGMARLKTKCKEGDLSTCAELSEAGYSDEELRELNDRFDYKYDELVEKNKERKKTTETNTIKTNLELAKEMCPNGIDRFEGDPNSTWRKDFEVKCK